MKDLVNKIKSFKEKKVAKNAMWIMGERITQMLISLVVGVISARYLGPSNYGTLNYGASLVTLFTSICKLGLENVIIKEYIDKRNENGKILGTAIVMRLISSSLSIITIIAIVCILKPNDKTMFIVTVLQAIALLFQVYELIDYWFQSHLNSKYVAISKTIAYIVVAVYKICLLMLQKPVEWFAFSTSLDYIIIMIIIFYMYKKNNGQKLEFSFEMAKSLFSRSYHFIFSALLVTLYTQMDKVMIGSYNTDKEVGLYSAATTISTMWGFIPEALINSFRPSIYEAKKVSDDLYIKKQKILFAIIFWTGIFFAIGITLFSDLIINILYGKDYIGAKPALLISAWFPAFSYLGGARGPWVVINNKNKYSKRYIFWGAVVNLALNAFLIPKWGINGAAIATLISQIVVAFIAPLFYKETRIVVKYMVEAVCFKGLLKHDENKI